MLYNQLPSVVDAHHLIGNFDKSMLEDILSDYDEFSLTLVHRHCDLAFGEIMIATGDITQPEKIHPSNAFPSAWLATGEPFEYNTARGALLPAELLTRFEVAVKQGGVPEVNGIPLLGICWTPTGLGNKEIYVERTEGRRNILSIEAAGNIMKQNIPTIWKAGETMCTCVNTPSGHLEVCKLQVDESKL